MAAPTAPTGGRAMPQPGASLVTPPQARKEVTVTIFRPDCERHTTRQNIETFFDPRTYSRASQKRTGSEALLTPSTTPATKARAENKVNKLELMEKFRLAAALNGYTVEEIFEAWFR